MNHAMTSKLWCFGGKSSKAAFTVKKQDIENGFEKITCVKLMFTCTLPKSSSSSFFVSLHSYVTSCFSDLMLTPKTLH